MDLTISPLTLHLWPAFEDLFGAHGAVGGCWCMYWRIGSDYRRRPGDSNKADFYDLVRNGPPPGLLACMDGLALGWCQLTPRSQLPWMEHAWRLRRVDDLPVWSLSCFYIRKGYRRRGVTAALLTAALGVAKEGGAPALEAYPLDADLTPSTSSTGYLSTFLLPRRKGRPPLSCWQTPSGTTPSSFSSSRIMKSAPVFSPGGRAA